MKIVSGYQNTRKNKEDFAITPFIFGVWVKGEEYRVCGFGLCWGWTALFIGIGFGLPKETPFFRNMSK